MWVNSLINSIDLLSKYHLLIRVAIRYANENSREINPGKLITSRAILFSHFQSRTQEASPEMLIDSFLLMHKETVKAHSRVQRSMTPPPATTSCEFSAHYLPIHGSTSFMCAWRCPWQSSVCDFGAVSAAAAQTWSEFKAFLLKRAMNYSKDAVNLNLCLANGEKYRRRFFLLLPLARSPHRSPRLWAENINSRLNDTYKGNLLFVLLGSVARSALYIILIGWGHVTSLSFFFLENEKIAAAHDKMHPMEE